MTSHSFTSMIPMRTDGLDLALKPVPSFAWLVLGNIHLIIPKHIKQQVPRAATLCDAQGRA